MATEKQSRANRNNAKRSTSPRTAQGKARASQNAVKHGLLAREAVIPGEDPADYEAHLAGLEAAYFAASIDDARDLVEFTEPEHLRPGNENLNLGTVMMRDAQSLVYFARYDAHLGRRFERAIQQLTRFREAREKCPKSGRRQCPQHPRTRNESHRSNRPPIIEVPSDRKIPNEPNFSQFQQYQQFTSRNPQSLITPPTPPRYEMATDKPIKTKVAPPMIREPAKIPQPAAAEPVPPPSRRMQPCKKLQRRKVSQNVPSA